MLPENQARDMGAVQQPGPHRSIGHARQVIFDTDIGQRCLKLTLDSFPASRIPHPASRQPPLRCKCTLAGGGVNWPQRFMR